MPVETGQYLSDLNANFPNPTDGASQGDDHLRLIKSVLKTTFPAVAGAVTGSHTDLNAAVAAASTGASKLADGGAHFNTNSTDGFTNPAAGEVDVEAGGNVVVKLKSDKSASFQGAVSSTGPIVGPGAWPVGMTGIWWSDTLPDASWGTFAWCNGGTYDRSNTALWNILGTKYGAGDGTLTANLPDLRDNVPVGKGTMGATGAVGRITQYVTSTLGTLIGEAKHLLLTGELPSHTHGPGSYVAAAHSHSYNETVSAGTEGGAGGNAWVGTYTTANTTMSGPHAVSGTSSAAGSDTAHNIVQPGIVCNYVIRIA